SKCAYPPMTARRRQFRWCPFGSRRRAPIPLTTSSFILAKGSPVAAPGIRRSHSSNRGPAKRRSAEVSPKVPGGRGRPSRRQPAATALALGWGCVACAGLQPSRSWSLSPARRLDLALERAADDRRHVGEKAKAWRRRRERAARTIARAQATDVNALERLTSEIGRAHV